MSNVIETGGIDVVILCGGLGKRLRPIVNDRPKAMAEINNRPFLDILIEHAHRFGLKRFILCIGYLGNVIKQYYQNKKPDYEIIFSEEKKLLGTAGAVKNAEALIRSSPFLVMNGDSFCPLDLRAFIHFHSTKKSELSLALIPMAKHNHNLDGVATLDDSDRIVAFAEKAKRKHGFFNTGVYLFDRSALSQIPHDTMYSLEYDLFPSLIGRDFYGFVAKTHCIDIGTPEGYLVAQQRLHKRIIRVKLKNR